MEAVFQPRAIFASNGAALQQCLKESLTHTTPASRYFRWERSSCRNRSSFVNRICSLESTLDVCYLAGKSNRRQRKVCSLSGDVGLGEDAAARQNGARLVFRESPDDVVHSDLSNFAGAAPENNVSIDEQSDSPFRTNSNELPLRAESSPEESVSEGNQLLLPAESSVEESVSEGDASKPVRLKREVYIVDIMPICFRGRGRGKLDPTACIEWMEALIGIAKDAPMIGVLDGQDGNAWRRELYPDYKSGRNLYRPFPTIGHRRNRHPVHIDPFVNMPMLGDLFRLLNIPVLKIHHAEADDVIATLAEQAVELGHRVSVVSPDTDLRQLLGEEVNIWAPRAELMRQFNFFDGRKLEERLGYPPEKWVLLRCLLGDQSDAIKGLPYYVPEFGRNTAIKLIEKFTTVDELLAAAQVRTIGRPYVQEAVLTYAKVLQLNESLITLRRDVEGVVFDSSWLRPRDRSTEREAYNTAKFHLRVMKREGKQILVRPSPESNRKLSGIPIVKKEKPKKDRSPKWPPGFVDHKGLLQTACAQAKIEFPEYSLETEGLIHEPLHRATVSVGGRTFVGPPEKLKKTAEHAAARTSWEALLKEQHATDDIAPEQQAQAVRLALIERTLDRSSIEKHLQTH